MKKLQISHDLSLPPEAVTHTFGLLAVRGAGKTNAARVLAAAAQMLRWRSSTGREGKRGGITGRSEVALRVRLS
jgi:hypothetical protein